MLQSAYRIKKVVPSIKKTSIKKMEKHADCRTDVYRAMYPISRSSSAVSYSSSNRCMISISSRDKCGKGEAAPAGKGEAAPGVPSGVLLFRLLMVLLALLRLVLLLLLLLL